jgi:hypothetical protein
MTTADTKFRCMICKTRTHSPAHELLSQNHAVHSQQQIGPHLTLEGSQGLCVIKTFRVQENAATAAVCHPTPEVAR